MRIAERVFVVTGGGNGMGRQVVLGLARRGARVAAVDIDAAGLTETAELARAAHAAISTHIVNVTDSDAVAGLPDQVTSVHGQIDGLVNIAGVIHRFAPFTDLSADELARIMEVNFWGTVNTCRVFLPILLQRPEANLTNMSSLAALVPFASQTFYGASKGAVKQFSEGLYAELSDTNVHVVTLFPGNVSTNLTGNSGVEMLGRPQGADQDPGGGWREDRRGHRQGQLSCSGRHRRTAARPPRPGIGQADDQFHRQADQIGSVDLPRVRRTGMR